MTQRSPLKVSPQYRWRVQQRITVLEYATTHGMAAAGRHYGVSAKTVRRWRDRWQAGGVPDLVPRYPRRRVGRIRPELVPLIEHARKELGYGAARTRVWLQRVHQARGPGHGDDPAGVPRPGRAPAASDPQAAAAPAEAVRAARS